MEKAWKVVRNVAGQKFGDWTVIKPTERPRYWIAQCKCGLTKAVYIGNLINGISTRCIECSKKEKRAKSIAYKYPEKANGRTHKKSSTMG